MCAGLGYIGLVMQFVCLVGLCVFGGFSKVVNWLVVLGWFMRGNLDSASATWLVLPLLYSTEKS